MKIKAIILLNFIFLLSCSGEDESTPLQHSVTKLLYAVKLKHTSNQLIYSQEYVFEGGKVVSEKFINGNQPAFNGFTEFQYDENGRVVKEINNGELLKRIVWRNNVAQVYNKNSSLIATFRFKNSKLVEYERSGEGFRKLNYDSNSNVVSMENSNGVFVEFLNYDTAVENPFHLLNSIDILRIDYKPHFKNIFSIEKAYPYRGDDYNFPLTYYDYTYTFNTEGRVKTIEDEKTLIYISEFSYE